MASNASDRRFVGEAFRDENRLEWIQLTKLRVMGTIAAIDVNNSEKAGYLNNVGREIRHQAIAHGVLLRPLGNVLYLMPPYCITESELTWVYEQIDRVLNQVLD